MSHAVYSKGIAFCIGHEMRSWLLDFWLPFNCSSIGDDDLSTCQCIDIRASYILRIKITSTSAPSWTPSIALLSTCLSQLPSGLPGPPPNHLPSGPLSTSWSDPSSAPLWPPLRLPPRAPPWAPLSTPLNAPLHQHNAKWMGSHN